MGVDSKVAALAATQFTHLCKNTKRAPTPREIAIAEATRDAGVVST